MAGRVLAALPPSKHRPGRSQKPMTQTEKNRRERARKAAIRAYLDQKAVEDANS